MSESLDRFLEVVAVARPTMDHVLVVGLPHVPLTVVGVSNEIEPGEVDDARRSQIDRSVADEFAFIGLNDMIDDRTGTRIGDQLR